MISIQPIMLHLLGIIVMMMIIFKIPRLYNVILQITMMTVMVRIRIKIIITIAMTITQSITITSTKIIRHC